MAQPIFNQRLIIILSAVLLAAIVVGIIVYLFLPSSPEQQQPQETNIPTTSFDTSVTQQPAYIRLNTKALQEGALPVVPPPVTGKANPFL